MNILWLTWKDMKHPLAGGAEVVNEELAKRLVADGHTVHFVVGGWNGCTQEETRDGFHITRLGNRYTVYLHAIFYYFKHLKNQPFDLVIDEINTAPFFASWYVKPKTILFVHQLAREIWFYQMPFPFSLVGYIGEPIYLWLLRNSEVITISESTKQDLIRYGFKPERIHIISEGIHLTPVADLSTITKYEQPTILSLGAVRAMKRTLETVKAFEILKAQARRDRLTHGANPLTNTRLIIAGDTSDSYGKKVLEYIKRSPYASDIEVLGRVSTEKKMEIMQRSHLISVTSVKEGWGLIVTEANSQGTPACVYNVDGLRDSVKNNETGIVTQVNTPQSLADAFAQLLSDTTKSTQLREAAWQWSKEITFEKSYEQFKNLIAAYV